MGRHAEARERLWNSVEGLNEAQLRRPNADGWTILHVLEHLHLVEMGVAGAIMGAVKSPPMANAQATDSFEARLLNRSYKVDAPEIFQPQGAIATTQEAQELLSSSRDRLEAAVAAARNAGAMHTHGFPHALLGPMSVQQWYEFIPLHELRHVAQIEEMKAAQTENPDGSAARQGGVSC